MLNASFSFTGINLDKLFTDNFRKEFEIQIKQGLREFVREAIQHVPIDTGQARGTFLPLGKFLRINIPIAGAKPDKGIKSSQTGAENYPIVMTIKSGRNFEYVTLEPQLFYFKLMDNTNRSSQKNPTPWRAFQEGTKAFELYMETQGLKKLPGLAKLFKVTNYVFTQTPKG